VPTDATSSAPLRAIKRQARSTALGTRADVTARIDTAGAARAIAAHVLATFELRPGTAVSAFWPVRDELDLRDLLHALHARGCVCALPVVTGKATPLTFRHWVPGVELVTSAFGIPEPGPERPIVAPDLSLVPLLAFDDDGYRLGYGGGFYDRTLALHRAAAAAGERGPYVAAGVGFSGLRVADVPHDHYDQRLDWMITEAGAVRCGA
jgi:5-formyltetrahydrofolate cyclo-ligase